MKKVWVSVCVVIACVAFVVAVRPATATMPHQEEEGGPTSTVTPIPLIVGVGQSNMAGKGATPVTPFPTIAGAVKMVWDDDLEHFVWEQMSEPSSVWLNSRTSTPPHNYFYSPVTALVQHLMTEKGWTKIAFINCGVGGSYLSSWAPTFASASNAVNFNSCWQRITSAQSTNHYKVVGVVMIHGESDAGGTPPVNYEDDMNKLYQAFNVRLQTKTAQPDRTAIPMAFLVLGATPTGTHSKLHWATVRAIQLTLPVKYPSKNWIAVDSWGIPRDSSYHFFPIEDVDEIGILLANGLLQLTSLPPSTPSRTPTLTLTPTPTLTPP